MRNLILFLIFLTGFHSFANNPGVSYQGRIIKPDGNPLEGNAVQFRMQIRSPGSENCLLYEEIQSINMAGSSGVFAVTLNDGSGTRLDTPTYQIDRIFANRDSMVLDSARCSLGTSYAPNSVDGRKFVVYFKDETMTTYEPLPIMSLNYAPQAMYALESQKVDKFSVNNILRAVDVSGNPVTAPALDPTQLTNLNNLLSGTSTQYATTTQFNTVQAFAKAAPPTCGGSEVLKSNGTSLSCVAGGAPSLPTTGAAASNTIDSTNFGQIWNWSTATTQSPMTMSADTLTTGSVLKVSTSSSALNSSNGLINVANTSASSNGVLARFQSNSTVGSGLTVLANGSVGIGTTSPTGTFHVAGGTAAASTNGSPITLTAQNGGAGNQDGGNFVLNAGNSGGSGARGNISITAGNGNSAGGEVELQGGSYAGNEGGGYLLLYGSGSTVSGPVILRSMDASGMVGGAGDVSILTGNSQAGYSNSNGGNINIIAGNGAHTSSLGGTINIAAGNGGAAGPNNGSNVIINPGAKSGAGNDGNIVLANLRGNVGIGTSSPSGHLQILGTSGGNDVISSTISSGSSFDAGSFIGTRARGTVSAATYPVSGDRIASFASANGVNPNAWAFMGMFATENQTSAAQGTAIRFYTIPNGSTTSFPRMSVDYSGYVGIGTTSPQTMLQVAGVISPATNNSYTLGSASYRFTEVYATNGVINTSDRREKKDIFNTDLGLDFINNLRPVSYRWNTGVDSNVHYGLIAQEAEKVLLDSGKVEKTSIVTYDETIDRYGVRYSELISPIIKAIQELYSKMVGMDREIASLKTDSDSKISRLEMENEKLKNENEQIKERLDQIENALKLK